MVIATSIVLMFDIGCDVLADVKILVSTAALITPEFVIEVANNPRVLNGFLTPVIGEATDIAVEVKPSGLLIVMIDSEFALAMP